MRLKGPNAPSDSTTGWSRTAQDAAEAEYARMAEKHPAADENPALPPEPSTAQPFLERRIGFGNGRHLLIVIVLVLALIAFIFILASHRSAS
jgi:hypothetical protein